MNLIKCFDCNFIFLSCLFKNISYLSDESLIYFRETLNYAYSKIMIFNITFEGFNINDPNFFLNYNIGGTGIFYFFSTNATIFISKIKITNFVCMTGI